MKTNTQKIVAASMLAALCCVATMIIKIPAPLNGYINMGDAVVLLSGWLLSPLYAFLVAGIGSALADVFSGYLIYAPATFFIKGIVALVAGLCFRAAREKKGRILSKVIGGGASEIIMVLGYFVFEGFLYGFGPSVVNIPLNAVQGAIGLIVGILLAGMFEKTNIF